MLKSRIKIVKDFYKIFIMLILISICCGYPTNIYFNNSSHHSLHDFGPYGIYFILGYITTGSCLGIIYLLILICIGIINPKILDLDIKEPDINIKEPDIKENNQNTEEVKNNKRAILIW